VQLLPGVAARVNGHAIDADSVNRTVAGMDARVRRSETVARHDVLSRMIDEELLVQHALDSGAAETNPEVRAALVRSAITRVNSEAAAEPVSEREVSQYFEAHKEAYAAAASFDVTALYFDAIASRSGTASQANPSAGRKDNVGAANGLHGRLAADAGAVPAHSGNGPFAQGADADAASSGHGALTDASAARLRAAAARAAIESGTPVGQVANSADPLPFAAPGARVSPRTLANYFGPGLAEAVGHLAVGHTTDITQLGNGVVLIYLNNKTPGEIPSLASVHELVAADALRDRQEHALEALLASLRQTAHVELATASR
jgi:hypothetical protein